MNTMYTSIGGGGGGGGAGTISTNNGTGVVNVTIGSTTITEGSKSTDGKLSIKLDGESVDIARQVKMFMWWMQTYNPKAIEEFNAIEDIKRKP